ncbi:MAG: signal peptidase I [Eubacteriales bacterium]|nr:signal peptidase I [Eubacteriales bacterium]
MKTVCRVLSAAILVIFILLYLPLTVPQLFGYDCSAVVSASMEPAIKTGALVYFAPVDPVRLTEGDVIVFRSSYGTDVSDVCHRVVSNDTEKQEIITKGDANSNNDFVPARYDLVRGKVVKTIPFGGNIALFLTSVGGKRSMAGLLLPAVLLHIAGSSAERKTKRR